MTVYNRLEDVPNLSDVVLTIGTFDGIHLGHQELLRIIKNRAEEVNGTSVLLTFHPHPRIVLQPDSQDGIQLITTIDERIELLEKTGIDVVVIVPFSVEFANMPADDYLKNVLINHFHPKEIIIGYDHHFGKNRTGNFDLLAASQELYDYQLTQIPKQTLEKNAYSSTAIRQALNQGEIHKANKLLGYNYFINGIVSHGDKRGRELGYPTANIQLIHSDKLIPANGVYAVRTWIDGKAYDGMLNIGIRPTFRGEEKTIENHLFNFDQDIYGKAVRTEFIDYLRPERKFDSIEALKNQLAVDERQAKQILKNQS